VARRPNKGVRCAAVREAASPGCIRRDGTRAAHAGCWDTRRNERPAFLVYFKDASRLDDRRLFLALGKAHGALTVYIDAGKALAIMIVDGDLPVTMPAPAIFVKTAGLALTLSLRFLFHGSATLGECSDYRKFAAHAQVPS